VPNKKSASQKGIGTSRGVKVWVWVKPIHLVAAIAAETSVIKVSKARQRAFAPTYGQNAEVGGELGG